MNPSSFFLSLVKVLGFLVCDFGLAAIASVSSVEVFDKFPKSFFQGSDLPKSVRVQGRVS